MDNDREGIKKALLDYARFGVTGIFPTTLSCPFSELEAVIEGLTKASKENYDGAEILGLHLEGPYFSKEQCGAQAPDVLCNPSDKKYKEFIEKYPLIKRWDLAPELDGAYEMAEYMSKKGVVSAVAHTDASFTKTTEAFDHATIATHLYSGMSNVRRVDGFRQGGAVEACLLDKRVFTEAICDGIHLPPELLKLIYKIKGSKKMCLVTDSMRGAAMPEGSKCMLGHKKRGTEVVVSNGVAWLPDKSSFAGSVATFDVLLRTAQKIGIPIEKAVQMATEAPAKAMKLKNKGFLKQGFDADIVIFDKNINILQTICNGNIAYKKEGK